MIELGDKQFELNRELGRYIGENVDEAVIVGEYNRDALVSGVRDSQFPEEHLHIVDSFNDAQKLLGTMLASGDTILYENDLPDTFK
jgi:UDP-N-acetylmuramoyl-tripeptide--D-alanyl-D-alanine ligase